MISTGIAELDAALGGGLEGVTVILGKTGSGKSILARHLALNAHKAKLPVHVEDCKSPNWDKGITCGRNTSAAMVFESIRREMPNHRLSLIENVGGLSVPNSGVASSAKFWTAAVRAFHEGCSHHNSAVVMTWNLNSTSSGQAHREDSTPTGVQYMVTNILRVESPHLGDLRVTVRKSRYGRGMGTAVDLVVDRLNLAPIKRRSVWERLGEDDL